MCILVRRTAKRAAMPAQAIEKETCPGAQHGIVKLVSHRQKRAAELLPNIMLAKRLLGEVRSHKPPPSLIVTP